MNPIKHVRVWAGIAAGILAASWLPGCASEEEIIVGSNQIVERETAIAVLEALRIRVPFDVSLKNGEPKRVLLRGEDNLLDLIRVEEEAVNHWRLVAEPEVEWEQHAEIEIEVPYIDMVQVMYNRDSVRFIDKPGTFQKEP